MDIDRYDPGVPCWVDLGTPDMDRAVAFYSALFGWSIDEGPEEAGGYRMALLHGRPAAGFGPQMNPGPPVWATYISVESADATAQAVTANGGTIVAEPMDVLTVGRMAVCIDPAGAFFSLWQPRDHAGAGVVNEPGAFSWNELLTSDVEGAKAFYGAVFGWGSDTHGEGPAAYTEFTLGGRTIGGMMAKPEMIPPEVPPFWGVYFTVNDTDTAVARITELGGAVVMPPTDIEPGRFAVVSDPTGATFNVITMAESAG